MQTNVVLRRIVAIIIDGILLGVASAILLTVLDVIGINVWNIESTDFSWSATSTLGGTLISAALSLGYKAWMEGTYNGQTLGKMALGIRVVKDGTGASISMADAALRGFFWVTPFALLDMGFLGLIGFFWLAGGFFSLIFSPTRQRLGDRVAGTIVIRDDPSMAFVAPAPHHVAAIPIAQAAQPRHELLVICDFCKNRFPRSQANRIVRNGTSTETCPYCGAPLDSSQTPGQTTSVDW